jgi:hypothetical protein
MPTASSYSAKKKDLNEQIEEDNANKAKQKAKRIKSKKAGTKVQVAPRAD